MSNILYRTRTYLVGHMQYSSGEDWRSYVESELNPLGIITYNPYSKPFVKDLQEDDDARNFFDKQAELGNYDYLQDKMRQIRNYDLNLVDRSDFIIARIIPEVPSYGSSEELAIAARMKKPIFLAVEGGKKKAPHWLWGMLPHKYFYDSVEQIVEKVKDIDSGKIEIDSDRWRLLVKELR